MKQRHYRHTRDNYIKRISGIFIFIGFNLFIFYSNSFNLLFELLLRWGGGPWRKQQLSRYYKSPASNKRQPKCNSWLQFWDTRQPNKGSISSINYRKERQNRIRIRMFQSSTCARLSRWECLEIWSNSINLISVRRIYGSASPIFMFGDCLSCKLETIVAEEMIIEIFLVRKFF